MSPIYLKFYDLVPMVKCIILYQIISNDQSLSATCVLAFEN